METQEIFKTTPWHILKELSKGNKSASEIAKKTGQTLANTTIQLKILEAKGLVKKGKLQSQEKRKTGKPKIPYALNQEVALAGVLRNGLAENKTFKYPELSDFQKCQFNAAVLLDGEEHYALIKYLLDSDLFSKADLVALAKTEKNEIELFIISETHLDEIRHKHSNKSIHTPDDKTKKIISWSHNKKEVEEGLERGEEYFLNLVKRSQELFDKRGLLSEWTRR